MIRLLCLILLLLAACTGKLEPVHGTTVRVAEPVVDPESELTLKIFTSRRDCMNSRSIKPVDQPLCMPWVDRKSGEVHLAFQFLLSGEPWPMPLGERDNIRVTHQGTIIQDGYYHQAYQLIPHDPSRSPQLYILLIDGSASMNQPEGRPRIEELRKALLLPEVVTAFFPESPRTGVLLLTFVGGRMLPVGGTLKVIDNPKDYRKVIREDLAPGTGYTYLYDAIEYATGTLLTSETAVTNFLRDAQASPTVIALTDGFNNERAEDTCGSNATQLEALLRHLEKARGPEQDLRSRPQVFTVGLGTAFRPQFKLPATSSKPGATFQVRAKDLCGKDVNATIDGDLERRGIDNASLTWIARLGGGTAYLRQDASGLGKAFQAAAASQYDWFEVRYRMDAFHLRRSFKTGLSLMAYARSQSSVYIHPSGWMDGPPGIRGPDGWTRPGSVLRVSALVMPILGALVALGFLPAALYNTRRVLFGRLRPPRPPRAPKGQ